MAAQRLVVPAALSTGAGGWLVEHTLVGRGLFFRRDRNRSARAAAAADTGEAYGSHALLTGLHFAPGVMNPVNRQLAPELTQSNPKSQH